MTDTAITPATGSAAVTGLAPVLGVTLFPGVGSAEARGYAATPETTVMTVIQIPCGSAAINGYAPRLQGWASIAASATTWTNL